MEQEVQPAPPVLDGVEDDIELTGCRDIAGEEERRLDLSRERLDVGLGLVVEIGDAELGADATEVLGRRPGKAVVVGDTDDQTVASLQINEFHGEAFRSVSS